MRPGLAVAGWSWPFWANVATDSVVSNPTAMAAAVLAMIMVKMPPATGFTDG